MITLDYSIQQHILRFLPDQDVYAFSRTATLSKEVADTFFKTKFERLKSILEENVHIRLISTCLDYSQMSTGADLKKQMRIACHYLNIQLDQCIDIEPQKIGKLIQQNREVSAISLWTHYRTTFNHLSLPEKKTFQELKNYFRPITTKNPIKYHLGAIFPLFELGQTLARRFSKIDTEVCVQTLIWALDNHEIDVANVLLSLPQIKQIIADENWMDLIDANIQSLIITNHLDLFILCMRAGLIAENTEYLQLAAIHNRVAIGKYLLEGSHFERELLTEVFLKALDMNLIKFVEMMLLELQSSDLTENPDFLHSIGIALGKAHRDGHLKMVDLLLENLGDGIEENSLITLYVDAIEANHPEIATKVPEQYRLLTLPPEECARKLETMISLNNLAAVLLILRKGPALDQAVIDQNFALAVERRSHEVVKEFLRAKAGYQLSTEALLVAIEKLAPSIQTNTDDYLVIWRILICSFIQNCNTQPLAAAPQNAPTQSLQHLLSLAKIQQQSNIANAIEQVLSGAPSPKRYKH